MAQRVNDRFPRRLADAARLRAVPLQYADPLVFLASAFEQDVDIALPCVAFEEIKDQQAGPLTLVPRGCRHRTRIAARLNVGRRVLERNVGLSSCTFRLGVALDGVDPYPPIQASVACD
jgi:hypothetical protein